MNKGRFTLLGRVSVLIVVLVAALGCSASASFFEGFDSEASFSNWNGWGPVGTWDTISGGQLTMTPPAINDGLWVTSNQTFLYGTYEIRMRFDNTPWNWSYFGFFNRSPWTVPIACMRTDVNLMLAAGDGVGSNWDALNPNSPVLAPNEWHTIKIIWQPGSIESVYDGTSLGTYTTYVASTAMPIVLDVGRGQYSSAPAVFEVDYVKVDDYVPVPEPSALASLAAMSGMLGVLIRRRMR